MSEEIKEIDKIIINVKRTLQFSPERRFVELFNKDEINKLLDYITNLQEENERLNNIINELEKWLSYEWYEMSKDINPEEVLDKLKELKEGKRSEK